MSRRLIDDEIFDDDYVLEEFEINVTPETPPLHHIDRLTTCPRCNKPLVPSLAINGGESTFFRECPACGTLVNTFKPLPHQAEFLSHPARFKMAAGGYGSGKSAVDIQYVIKHLLLIPRARVCVSGRSYPALESTFIEEFMGIMPVKLLRRKNEQKREYEFTNGSVLLIRSFDDPTKLKSMNLTLVVIVEASDVPKSGFEMMKSRIRNNAALIPEYDLNGEVKQEYDPATHTNKIKYRVDARHILLETNPASNWVKQFMLSSGDVRYYGTAHDEGYGYSGTKYDNQFTQVISTDANPYLPDTYIDDLCKGQSPAWVAQFVKGSFNFNNNLVFPNVGLTIKHPHPLPRAFDEYGRRVLYYLIGLDYGINDPTHVVYCAYSTETKKIYVYDELRITNADVRTIAKEYRKNTRINGTDLSGLLMLPRFDGRSYNKRESDLHTIGGAFEACGLHFEPSFTSHEIRIIKLNSLINHDQIEIFSTCEFLIEELVNYSYTLDKNGKPTNKPKDGNDHGITALEFIVVELPHNLQELKVSAYLPNGTKFTHDDQLEVVAPKPKKKVYNPLEQEVKRDDSIINNRHYSITSVISDDDPEDETGEADRGVLSCYIPGKY